MKPSTTAKPRWTGTEKFEAAKTIFREAAYAMIRSGSVQQLSMRGLADAVGVSPMTAYRYYPDKKTLIEDVRRLAWRNFAQRLCMGSDQQVSAEERFRRLCQGYLTFAIECRPEFQLLFEPAAKAERRKPENIEAWHVLTESIKGLAPSLSEDIVRQHAYHTWSSMHGLAMLYISHGSVFDKPVEDTMDAIADSIIIVVRGQTDLNQYSLLNRTS
ncbi:TetR/AcrR family transcriptional regulator [Sphingomonas sp. PB2P12]|uniref:TetR/AcrR family transcriptional regulator n=1 Tax=Sphingomonas sandaracina TaxID=3096157 RepID=UPI002FC64CDF